MKKTLFPIVLMSALFVAVSCSKSFDPSEEGTAESKVFTATIEDESTKTTLDETKVNWVKDDAISINGVKYLATPKTDDKTKADFAKSDTKENPTSPYIAYYPYSIYDGTTATLPATQTYDAANPFSINPMYAYAEETNGAQSVNFSFKNICGILKITLSNPRCVNTITIESSTEPVCGAFTVDNSSYAVTMSGTGKTVTLNCGGAYAQEFYVALPPQTYTKLTVTIAGMGLSVSKSLSSKTIARNTIYNTKEIDVSPAGKFTVASGKQVVFSPGNLQAVYSTSTSKYTWQFAAHQYDYIGNKAGNTTIDNQSTGNVVDLFGWSTSTTNYGIKTSTSSSSYLGDFNDWGTLMGSGWRTLTQTEWDNLCGWGSDGGKRTQANRFAKAMVNGVKGFLIFPDGYNGTTSGTGIATVNSTSATYPSSSIPAETWTTMEAAGCVFLPAAGCRSGSGVNYAGDYGDYWSSTPFDEYYACYLDFGSNGAGVYFDYRYVGRSVRLARE